MSTAKSRWPLFGAVLAAERVAASTPPRPLFGEYEVPALSELDTCIADSAVLSQHLARRLSGSEEARDQPGCGRSRLPPSLIAAVAVPEEVAASHVVLRRAELDHRRPRC